MEAGNKKLIIFDFDGVFNLESMEAYYHTYGVAMFESGVDLDAEVQREVIDRAWGSSHKEIILELLREAAGGTRDPDSVPVVDPEFFKSVVERYEEILADDFCEMIKPVPGAALMLGRLANRYTLALNTAADPAVLLEQVMPKLKIEPEMFQGGMMMALDLVDDRRAKPKPHPYTTKKIMERNGVEPEQAIMVGDSGSDIETALYAGIDDIYVPLTGKLTAAEAAEYGVKVIPDVTYLERHLENGGSGSSSHPVDALRTIS